MSEDSSRAAGAGTGLRALRLNLALALATFVACGLLIEAAYRLFDPFPYFPPSEVNRERGHLTRYDPELGWRGTPGAKEALITENSKVWVEHNSLGFRDVEHQTAPPLKDAVVFLGDSFTWGYEIETDAMFVNRIRRRLPGYEVFNLAHRGYGTDQSLLAFRAWRYPGRLRLVVLMFCENDFEDNASSIRYNAHKPFFELSGDQLLLANVPVPPTDKWRDKGPPPEPALEERLLVALSSQFLHDVYFRLKHVRRERAPDYERKAELVPLTARIVRQLRDEVSARQGKLLFVAIPSKRQFRHEPGFAPYQQRIQEPCDRLGVPFLDLAPAFEHSFLRTYFRIGDHWNGHGNAIAAQALLEHLTKRADLLGDASN